VYDIMVAKPVAEGQWGFYLIIRRQQHA